MPEDLVLIRMLKSLGVPPCKQTQNRKLENVGFMLLHMT